MQAQRQKRRRAGEARGSGYYLFPVWSAPGPFPPFAARVSSSVCMRSLAWAGRGDHVAGKPEEARLPGTSSALTARRSGVPRIPRRGLRGPAGNPGLSRRPGPERRQVSPRLARVQVENMATSNLLKVSPPAAAGLLPGHRRARLPGKDRAPWERQDVYEESGSGLSTGMSRGGCCPSTPTPGPGLGGPEDLVGSSRRLTDSQRCFQGTNPGWEREQCRWAAPTHHCDSWGPSLLNGVSKT